MSENALRALAKNAMFEIKDEEMNDFVEYFEVFKQQIEMLNLIDTEGIEPMDFPYITTMNYLREDEPIHVATQTEILSNAHDVENGQIKIPAVIKK